MVAGIIAVAAGDHRLIEHPPGSADLPATLMVLGGSAIFLVGHALIKAAVWQVRSRPRVVAVAFLLALCLLGGIAPALLMGILAAAIVLAVVVSDRHVASRPPA
jgi:low temperature requirement protein LtrA